MEVATRFMASLAKATILQFGEGETKHPCVPRLRDANRLINSAVPPLLIDTLSPCSGQYGIVELRSPRILKSPAHRMIIAEDRLPYQCARGTNTISITANLVP